MERRDALHQPVPKLPAPADLRSSKSHWRYELASIFSGRRHGNLVVSTASSSTAASARL